MSEKVNLTFVMTSDTNTSTLSVLTYEEDAANAIAAWAGYPASGVKVIRVTDCLGQEICVLTEMVAAVLRLNHDDSKELSGSSPAPKQVQGRASLH